MTAQEMIKTIREIKELELMASELNAEIEALKDTVKAEMTAQDTDTMTVDCFKVSYKAVTSSRFDTKTFKAQHSDLYTAYTKSTTSKRFTIN